MSHYSSLVELFKAVSNNNCSGVVYINGEENERFVSYVDLYNNALEIMSFLKSKNIKCGEKVILLLNDNSQFIECFWGCVLGGIIPVPVPWGNSVELQNRLFNIWDILESPYIITIDQGISDFRECLLKNGKAHTLDQIENKIINFTSIKHPIQSYDVHIPESNDIALIQFSSGSTGDPKGVMLSNDNILANVNAIIKVSSCTKDDLALGWMPLTHDMGLIGFHFLSLALNITQYIMPTSLFIRNPILWLEKAQEHKITVLLSPNFGYKHFLNYFNSDKAKDWDLSRIKLILNGAEPISVKLCKQFLNCLAPYSLSRNVMCSVYGLAEASLVVSFPIPGEGLIYLSLNRNKLSIGEKVEIIDCEGSDDAVEFVDLGYCLTDCSMRICNDVGIELEDNTVGYIHIKGRNVTCGYYKNTLATSIVFTQDGWLNTGDLGFIANKRLVVTGRAKEIIFINGQNYYPQDIERVAEGMSGIELGKIVACGVVNSKEHKEDIIIFVHYKDKIEDFLPLAIALKGHINSRMGLNIKNVIPISEIPKTISGKVQRYKLIDMYNMGDFSELITEIENLISFHKEHKELSILKSATEEQLIKIWGEILGYSEIGIHDNFYELGGDSLLATKIINKINEQIGIDASITDILSKQTISALAEFIDSKYLKNAECINTCLKRKECEFLKINAIDKKDYYMASEVQKRLFVLNQFDVSSTAHNISGAVVIEGAIIKEEFEEAFRQLVSRHESLRTSFEMIDGELVQKVHDNVEFKIDYMESRDESVDNTLNSIIKPFDLGKSPLFRVGLVKLKEKNHLLVVDMHHIISDGTSVNIIIKEFVEMHQGKQLLPLKVQYKDFAQWYTEYLNSDAVKMQEKYWLDTFKDGIPLLNLPTDYQRPSVRSTQGETIYFKFEKELTQKLNTLAHTNNATLFIVLLGIFSINLSKHSMQEDMVIGTVASGRVNADVENVVGAFIKSIMLRCSPKKDKTFIEYLKDLKEIVLGAYDNQDYPIENLETSLDIHFDRSRNALFDVMIVENIIGKIENRIQISNLEIRSYNHENKESKYDMTLYINNDGDNVNLGLVYSTTLFKKDTIMKFANYFCNIAEEIVHNPEKTISQIQVLSEADRDELLFGFNKTKTDYPTEITILDLIEKQAIIVPDDIAAVFEDSQITYKELNEKANYLALKLKGKNIGKGDYVPVLMHEGIELIISLLAVIKTGAAFVPLSHEWPFERIKVIFDGLNSGIILVDRYISNKAFEDIEVIVIDRYLLKETGSNLAEHICPEDPIYVIYTSGSTGKPKGVVVPHKGIINRFLWMNEYFGQDSSKSVLQTTNHIYDSAVWQLFWPLINGGKTVIPICDKKLSAEYLANIISNSKITLTDFVPSIFNFIVNQLAESEVLHNKLNSLKDIIVGGEEITPNSVYRFMEYFPHVKVNNLYGPTEASIGCIAYRVTGKEENKIPIGKPISNVKILILDDNLNIIPRGAVGEIYITGDCLALGYLNDSEKTKQVFIDNPYKELGYDKIYKTGDIARYLPDGNIDFLGRSDFQIKIRGFRIEPGEIESKILSYAKVKEAVVVVREKENTDKYLCAYLVGNEPIDIIRLKDYMSKELPDYMIPSCFIQLECMPVTQNGKVNRKALPEPDITSMQKVEYVAPENEIEEKLAVIKQEVLGLEKIGTNDDFFELGGNSLKAMLYAAKISKVFEVEVSIKEIFNFTTVKKLSEHIKDLNKKVFTSIEPIGESEYYELSPAQKRLYILNQMEGISTSYNIPEVVQVEGQLNIEHMENAFNQLIQRHETLRTSFVLEEWNPKQRVHNEVEFGIEVIETEINDIDRIVNNFIRPFSLEKAPLMRVGVVRRAEDNYLLLFDMHHIISDGVSIGILIKEMLSLYMGEQLPELKIQYKDFAQWQINLLESDIIKQQEQYWIDVLNGEIPTLNMPTDYPRPSTQSFEGDRIIIWLGEELTHKLNKLVSETGATMYMLLLGAYNVLLSKYSGQEDIIVGSPAAGRVHADLENIIGMFVNTLVMRNYPKSSMTFGEFIESVKENCLKAFDNQNYQFEELINKLEIVRDMSRNPLFDTMFVMQNQETLSVDRLQDMRFMPYEIKRDSAKFDLTLDVVDSSDNICLRFEYCRKIFKKETIQRLAGYFINILGLIIEQPDILISDIELMTEIEKTQILQQFNDTKCEYASDKSIHELFEEHAIKTPEMTAIVFEEKSVTYKELNEQSNKIAWFLKNKGIGENSVVGVIFERSIELIVAIMGVLKAGAAYLPVDLSYPESRIDYLLKNSNTSLCITQQKYINSIINSESIEFVDVDEVICNNRYNIENLNIKYNSERLIYILYTSGSTGNPKGSMIKMNSFENLLNWYTKEFNICSCDNVLLIASIGFDLAQKNIFAPLIKGASLHIFPAELYDYEKMSNLIEKQNITIINCTPSAFYPLLDFNQESDFKKLKSLESIFLGGEPINLTKFLSWGESHSFNAEVVNTYGPTECTDIASFYRVDNKNFKNMKSVSIGKPIDNVQLFILDSNHKPVPLGIVGELYIGGIGVGMGYYNNEDMTKSRFLELPHIWHGVIYKTGDLAKWLDDGNIEYLGRIDNQVKIRGFRIELGEIEHQLLKHDLISEVVVTCQKDNNMGNYICAYLVSKEEISVTDLRKYLLVYLPDFMVPAHFVSLEKMPLTPNGKIDMKALPKLSIPEICTEYAPPENYFQETLEEVWSNILGKDRIGIDDNFFELGGDSIKTIQIAAALRKYKLKLSVMDMFKNPTIRKMSKVVETISSEIEQDIVEGDVPLTPVQKWFFEKRFNQKHHFNQSVMLHSIKGFDETAIRKAFSEIINHHDALRMIYRFTKDEIAQYNRGKAEELFSLEIYELMNGLNNDELIAEKCSIIQSKISLENGPLVKLGLFKTLNGDHLLIAIHHLVVDGVSWRIILEDFSIAYLQCLNNQEITLQGKTHSFKNWSNVLRVNANSNEFVGEISYWRNLQNHKIDFLPGKGTSLSSKVCDRENVKIILPADKTRELLDSVNRAYNTEINDILLAALGMTIKEWIGQDKVLINLEGHGREQIDNDIDISRTVGWFTSMYPVLLEVSDTLNIGFTIKSIKESIRKIPKNGIGYGILRYLSEDNVKNSLNRINPEISFNYLGQTDHEFSTEIFNISSISTGHSVAQENELPFTLEIVGVVSEGSLKFNANYSKYDFEKNTIKEVMEKFKNHLLDIIGHCVKKKLTEHTPGDYANVEISIEELDDINNAVDDFLNCIDV